MLVRKGQVLLYSEMYFNLYIVWFFNIHFNTKNLLIRTSQKGSPISTLIFLCYKSAAILLRGSIDFVVETFDFGLIFLESDRYLYLDCFYKTKAMRNYFISGFSCFTNVDKIWVLIFEFGSNKTEVLWSQKFHNMLMKIIAKLYLVQN